MDGSDRFYRPAGAPIRPTTDRLIGRCTSCKQSLGDQITRLRKGRICFLCNRLILRHEKYFFVESGVRHRDCDDPEGYGPIAVPMETVVETGR